MIIDKFYFVYYYRCILVYLENTLNDFTSFVLSIPNIFQHIYIPSNAPRSEYYIE